MFLHFYFAQKNGETQIKKVLTNHKHYGKITELFLVDEKLKQFTQFDVVRFERNLKKVKKVLDKQKEL